MLFPVAWPASSTLGSTSLPKWGIPVLGHELRKPTTLQHAPPTSVRAQHGFHSLGVLASIKGCLVGSWFGFAACRRSHRCKLTCRSQCPDKSTLSEEVVCVRHVRERGPLQLSIHEGVYVKTKSGSEFVIETNKWDNIECNRYDEQKWRPHADLSHSFHVMKAGRKPGDVKPGTTLDHLWQVAQEHAEYNLFTDNCWTVSDHIMAVATGCTDDRGFHWTPYGRRTAPTSARAGSSGIEAFKETVNASEPPMRTADPDAVPRSTISSSNGRSARQVKKTSGAKGQAQRALTKRAQGSRTKRAQKSGAGVGSSHSSLKTQDIKKTASADGQPKHGGSSSKDATKTEGKPQPDRLDAAGATAGTPTVKTHLEEEGLFTSTISTTTKRDNGHETKKLTYEPSPHTTAALAHGTMSIIEDLKDGKEPDLKEASMQAGSSFVSSMAQSSVRGAAGTAAGVAAGGAVRAGVVTALSGGQIEDVVHNSAEAGAVGLAYQCGHEFVRAATKCSTTATVVTSMVADVPDIMSDINKGKGAKAATKAFVSFHQAWVNAALVSSGPAGWVAAAVVNCTFYDAFRKGINSAK